jgi:hypothetical protein
MKYIRSEEGKTEVEKLIRLLQTGKIAIIKSDPTRFGFAYFLDEWFRE